MGAATNIQWCHSTVNPVMGCDGCELYPSLSKVRATIGVVAASHGVRPDTIAGIIDQATALGPQYVKLHLGSVAQSIAVAISPHDVAEGLACAHEIEDAVARLYSCYAATLHRFFNASGTRHGYACTFDEPTMFPGRVAKTSRLGNPRVAEIADKPWLGGYRRLIFISDMGDALSRGVPFEFLLREIITPVTSVDGQRHTWLWLSKRPRRMALFSRWLEEQGIAWPENLVAMTTVTGPKTASRVRELMEVPARFHGLSLEPLWDYVPLSLAGIDWMIVGGESGASAKPFDLSWARTLRDACERAGTSFFMKQLGRYPHLGSAPIDLVDKHGGDWAEWPEDLRVRQLPVAWQIGGAPACDQHQLISVNLN